MTTKGLGVHSTLKRIAWAYGCAPKNSVEEARAKELLLEKIQDCNTDKLAEVTRERDGLRAELARQSSVAVRQVQCTCQERTFGDPLCPIHSYSYIPEDGDDDQT